MGMRYKVANLCQFDYSESPRKLTGLSMMSVRIFQINWGSRERSLKVHGTIPVGWRSQENEVVKGTARRCPPQCEWPTTLSLLCGVDLSESRTHHKSSFLLKGSAKTVCVKHVCKNN